MEWLLLLWALSTLKTPKPGQETTIRAPRDGSSHRVRFVTAIDKTTGKSASGWIALSTDTGLRFKKGEEVQILGRPWRWNPAPGGTFTGGVFM